MGADNVDIFKKIVFSLPSLKKQLTALFFLSFVYSGITYVAFRTFAPIELFPMMVPIAAVLIYFLPSLFAGEVFYRALPDYPRDWSFFLAFFNQLVLFLYSLVLSGANSPGNAWNIIWLAFITIYLTNILVLVMSVGTERIRRILGISLIQPVILLTVFHTFIGRALEISTYRYIFSFGALLVGAVFLTLLLLTVDYLIRSNTDVSAWSLTSGLLQNQQESLDLGFEARPDVQTLQIENGEKLTLGAPWVHPGPLGGFGGGKLSNQVISELNREEKGFFLHVPCTHEEDLADPEEAEKVIEAIEEPEKGGRASKMIHRDYGKIEFWGRRIDGKKIVYLQPDEETGIDDYDIGVFTRNIDMNEVLLVDLHNHNLREPPEKEVQYGTAKADELKGYFDDFLEELDDLKLRDYKAGFDVRQPEQYMMAMFEEADGQEVLIMGSDTNGVTDDLRELQESYRSEFDHVLLFSTDTHASIQDLANRKTSDIDEMQNVVENAVDSVGEANIGFTNVKAAPLKLLKNDYNGLVFSVNILIRLVIISLAVFYLLLVLFIF